MRRVTTLAWAIPALCALALGQSTEPKKEEGKDKELERFQVWAERVIYYPDSGRFTFTGLVTVIKGTLRVDCQEMDGLVDPKTRQFVKAVASGDVRIVTVDTLVIGADGRPVTATVADDAWRASCGHADYDLSGGRLVMTALPGRERPRLTRAKGFGEADTIVFLPDKGEYELNGNPVIRGEIPTGPVGKKPETKGTP